MKTITTGVSIEGNLIGERIDMKIDPTAFALVMKALVNLYSNNELAVLREISTNARDAHIEAGCGHLPIEVVLPSHLDPYLRIKDFGPGLGEDDIRDIYSQYGASTKRDTNDQVGSLGFGCKSPLAYTDQFRLVSIKDGLKINVLVSKDEDGGNMQIITREETTEHSGVTVEIPAARYNNFDSEARKFFRFWEPGTVLVNGNDPERITGRVISDDLMIIDGSTNYIVMGNVPYPVDRDRFPTDLNDGHSLVARVPIGAVEFVPSREALTYTKVTRTVIDEILAKFTVAIQTAVQDAVDKCATRPEVIATILDWRRALPESRVNGNYTYKGELVPHIYEVPGAAKDLDLRATTSSRSSSKLSAKELRERLDISWWVGNLFVYNYDRQGFSPTTKKKLNVYADNHKLVVSEYILLREKPKRSLTKWLPKGMLVDFAKIAEIKLPRTYNGGRSSVGRIAGSYDMWVKGEYKEGVEASSIDATKPLFYYVGKYGEAKGYASLVNEYDADCTIVTMPCNRQAKFLRNFPQALHLPGEAKRIYEKWVKSLTINQKAWINIHCINGWPTKDDLRAIKPDKVDDPALKRAARLASKDMPVISKQWMTFNRRRMAYNTKAFKFDNPLKKYPLFNRQVLRQNADHTYLYLNAVYTYLQNEAS